MGSTPTRDKFVFVKKTTTLFDLPQEILNHHLAPFLVNVADLNEVLPKTHRIVRKFPRGFVDLHHFNILKNKFKILIQRCEDYSGEKRYLSIYRVVQELGKPYTFPIYAHGQFKSAVLDKLIEFQDYQDPPLSEKWFKMFRRQCLKTIQTILDV